MRQCFLVISLLFSYHALASQSDIFKEANFYFEQRDNMNSLKEAKNRYEKIINTSQNNQEKIYAFDRFARLSLLEGHLGAYIWGKSTKNNAAVFERCIKLSTKINKENVGYESPEYIYWRAACIGLWADKSNLVAITLKYDLIEEMIDLIKYGEQRYSSFDGQAFALLKAGLHVRALKISANYSPEEAINTVNKCHENTYYNYVSFLLKAEAHLALGQKAEAQATLEQGILELEQKIVQQKIVPLYSVESTAMLAILKSSLKNIEHKKSTKK
jgi:hypothetical protein